MLLLICKPCFVSITLIVCYKKKLNMLGNFAHFNFLACNNVKYYCTPCNNELYRVNNYEEYCPLKNKCIY